jgi:hypothetical protein
LNYFLCNRWKGTYSHKWCMHSILPLAPRVKQPALPCHTYINSHLGESMHHVVAGTTLGCGTRPVSIGSRRRRAECTVHFGVISGFLTFGLRLGGGKTVLRLKVIRNCSKCYRSLREPAVPICIGFFRKPSLQMKRSFLLLRN